MGDANPIRTLGDYSKPSHEGYRNTIELPVGNNVLPLRSDTIRLVQNRCSFHELQSEDPNQHLKDFLKLVDSLDLDGENRERTRLPYAEAVYSNPRPQNQNGPPKQTPFTFHERTGPNPQPQALGTTFEAQVQDYMEAHTERMKRFENAIFKQREEINDRMAEIFGLLKELKTNRAPEKVLIIEEAKSPITKNEAEKETEAEKGTKNKPIKRVEREETMKASSSQPVGYYLKHRINEKLIEGLIDNHRFNDSLLGIRVGKVKGKTYSLLPRGPVYEAILRKKITRKEEIGGNFEIPCNIGSLKRMNALVDQGSNVNIIPLSTYVKLTDERPAEMDIRLSLASHSYIYPLGIAEDVLVNVAGYVYPVDFLILDIMEDEKRPFILGTPF
ncbi:MAK10-like protein [Tanacetum coccineum]